MPEAFDRCVKEGGRVRTITPKKGTYLHVCYPKGGGSLVSGEVKHTKDMSPDDKLKHGFRELRK